MINNFFQKETRDNGKYLAIPNDSNPRIIVPLTDRESFKFGLKIHNTASPKNRLINKLISYSFLPLNHFSSGILYGTEELEQLRDRLTKELQFKNKLCLSFYIGTANSKNRKITLQLYNKNNIIGYAKVAYSENSKNYLQNEIDTLIKLDDIKFKGYIFPQIISKFEYYNSLVCIQKNIFSNTKQIGYNLTDELLEAYLNFIEKTKSNDKSIFIEKIENIVNSLNLGNELNKKIINFIVDIKNIDFPVSWNHGDFVPYNIKKVNYKFAVVDWEFSRESGQPFYDLFHFVYQGKYQIFNRKPISLVREILGDSNNSKRVKQVFKLYGISEKYLKHFFVLYLVEALKYDLEIRENQKIEDNHYYIGLQYL